MAVPELSQPFPRVDHVLQQHIRCRVRLAGEENAEVATCRHRTLKSRQQREGGRVALARAGRSLHQQQWGVAVLADELPLARLEIVLRADRVERVEAIEEPLLCD